MATLAERNKRFARAQMRVLLTVPFFAPAVARLPVVWDPSIPTAATDGDSIRWNPDWFDKLPDRVLPTVLCHESAHCLLGHLWRMPGGGDWDTWNQAGDHAVNLMLKEWSAIVMAQRLADPFPFPDPADAYLADPVFSGKAEEVIYASLAARKQGKQPQQPSPGGPGKGGKGKTPSGQSGPGQSSGSSAPHSMPSFGQMIKPASSPAAQRQAKTNWDEAMAHCVAIAKGRGTLPGSVTTYVDELFSPKIPWWELLRNWLQERANEDWNWLKKNPYYDQTGFILPTLESERIGAVVFGRDTSGSVVGYREICRHFVTEEQFCLDDLKPAKLIDICCDTRITQVKEYRVGDKIGNGFPGGGGTDFRPVFEHAETLNPMPKCLVYLTDLDGVFPDTAPPYPVLWISYGSASATAPFGEVIHATE